MSLRRSTAPPQGKPPGPDSISSALLRAWGDSLFPWLRNMDSAGLHLGH